MKRKLHLTGGAHLDPVWMWDWREGFHANKATLKSVLDRMEEFDDFTFSTTSAQFYEWIEENEPEMFEKIRQRVKEGRWVICGSWWVQPDCNVPSGESFARHGLLAQRYFLEKFGVTAKTNMCPDSFGHNGMLPQLMKKAGAENYMFLRPMPHENADLPSRTFLWESPDGSQLRCYRIPFTYHLGPNKKLGKTIEDLMDDMMAEPQYGAGNVLGLVGAGNHGGGPTIRDIQDVNAYRDANQDKIEVLWSDPDRFFAELDGTELPVWKDDIQYHAPGCYSLCSMIKDMNRKGENALLRAEKFSVVSSALGKYTPKENLSHGWKQVLFNQFHDILAGTATEEAYFDARNQMGEALSIASRAENGAMQALSFRIDIPYAQDTLPMVVFNPHSWEITAPVEMECGMFRTIRIPDSIAVVDGEGNPVPMQLMDNPTKTFTRRRITFMAKVPPLGYNTYRIVEGPIENVVIRPTEPVLENDLLRVEFDTERGTVKSIYHKKLRHEFLREPSRARVIFDDTDTWGHTLTKLDNEIGEFGKAEFIGLDRGDVRTCIRFRSYYGDSILTQDFSLYEGEDMIRVSSRLNWREKRCALKLDFALNDESVRAHVGIPFAALEKKREGREEAMQTWCDVSGTDVGLAIANNNKYSVDFRENIEGITVLRSPAWVHHDPRELDPNEDHYYMEQGVQDFRYILKPHAGQWQDSDIARIAAVLNQLPVLQMETFHVGSLPAKNGYLQVGTENVLLSALKHGYDGGCTVIRLHEALGRKTETSIRFMDTEFTAEFAPFEVKTFRIRDGKAEETDLLEFPVKK